MEILKMPNSGIYSSSLNRDELIYIDDVCFNNGFNNIFVMDLRHLNLPKDPFDYYYGEEYNRYKTELYEDFDRMIGKKDIIIYFEPFCFDDDCAYACWYLKCKKTNHVDILEGKIFKSLIKYAKKNDFVVIGKLYTIDEKEKSIDTHLLVLASDSPNDLYFAVNLYYEMVNKLMKRKLSTTANAYIHDFNHLASPNASFKILDKIYKMLGKGSIYGKDFQISCAEMYEHIMMEIILGNCNLRPLTDDIVEYVESCIKPEK